MSVKDFNEIVTETLCRSENLLQFFAPGGQAPVPASTTTRTARLPATHALCQIDRMNFGRDANPLLVTIFLIVWTIVGILQLLDAVKGM